MNIIAPTYSSVTPVLLVQGQRGRRISGVSFDVVAGKPWSYVLVFDPTDRYSCGGNYFAHLRVFVLPTLCPPNKQTRVLASFTSPPFVGPVAYTFGEEVALKKGHSFSVFAWGEDLAFKNVEAL